VDSLAARGGETLICTYDGYPSWYGSIITKVVVDSAEEVTESNEENNEVRKTISVSRPTHTKPLLSDLFVFEFSLDPSTPIQGSPVAVRIGVYNQGNEKSGAFTVQWWAGEIFKKPACTWQVDSLAAVEVIMLTCTYDGYTSWYGSIITKVVVDSSEEVAESNEENNEYRKTIGVSRKS
jgi:subtilase family serine protease